MGFNSNVRVYAQQVFNQRVDFETADLVDVLLLPVEIGGFHNVKVCDHQSADANPGQRHRHRRTKSPHAGNADRCPLEAGVNAGSVPGSHQALQLFSRRYFAAPDQKQFVSVVQPRIRRRRKAVQDQYVGISFVALRNSTERQAILDYGGFFIDTDLHPSYPIACRRSSIRSSGSSRPTDSRTSVSVIPLRSRSSLGTEACDIFAG
jgi:hypothetical protein